MKAHINFARMSWC